MWHYVIFKTGRDFGNEYVLDSNTQSYNERQQQLRLHNENDTLEQITAWPQAITTPHSDHNSSLHKISSQGWVARAPFFIH